MAPDRGAFEVKSCKLSPDAMLFLLSLLVVSMPMRPRLDVSGGVKSDLAAAERNAFSPETFITRHGDTPSVARQNGASRDRMQDVGQKKAPVFLDTHRSPLFLLSV